MYVDGLRCNATSPYYNTGTDVYRGYVAVSSHVQLAKFTCNQDAQGDAIEFQTLYVSYFYD